METEIAVGIRDEPGGLSVRQTNYFGNLVRDRRIELRKMSLRAFASLIGISEQYLSKTERGFDPPPSEDVIERMEDELEIAKGTLFVYANVDGYRRIPPVVLKVIDMLSGVNKGKGREIDTTRFRDFMLLMEAIAEGRTTCADLLKSVE